MCISNIYTHMCRDILQERKGESENLPLQVWEHHTAPRVPALLELTL